MLLGIVGWVLVGLIVGFVASRVVDLRGDDPRISIGISSFAALLAGALYSWFSGTSVVFFTFWGWLVAGITAALAVTAWHVARHRAPYKRPKMRQSY
jgi:hypothetical protein